MESNYRYFNRDLSWLSFNYRVLLEAADVRLPLAERMNFIAIYSSNLEEFYKIRVADHQAVAKGLGKDLSPESQQAAASLVKQINEEVTRQLDERIHIYEDSLLPALRRSGLHFYQNKHVESFHTDYITRFFKEEIFPYLQPVSIEKGRIQSFLRDNRLYLAIRVTDRGAAPHSPGSQHYFVMKLPFSKVPRILELPAHGGQRYYIFMEDVIKANVGFIFPGYEVDRCYCIKTSRDADILIDDTATDHALVEQVRTKVKRRKTGAISRFVYDRSMPQDFLDYLVDFYRLNRDELVPGDKHLNLEDLRDFPYPPELPLQAKDKPRPLHLSCLDASQSVFRYVEQKDLLLFYPYHSFDHFLHFLLEAVHDPLTTEIMITQYRVAENSAVIGHLIAAAQNGKKVTVFVELKARFDEEHNLATAELMRASGIRILYSLPKLKVHAKVALVRRKDPTGHSRPCSFAYISTGNFNEKTATVYADCGLFTASPAVTRDLLSLFRILQNKSAAPLKKLLVPRFNLIPELHRLIDREIALARSGRGGRIVLKMNGLQDPAMISRLYDASAAGVEIDLLVRGICCLVPGQPFSRHIRVTRIVDTFLEHTRIWYFGGGGQPLLYMGSADWMERNLYRRIEAMTPVTDADAREQLITMLRIQLSDNQKASRLDHRLRNVPVPCAPGQPAVRAQYAFYSYLKARTDRSTPRER